MLQRKTKRLYLSLSEDAWSALENLAEATQYAETFLASYLLDSAAKRAWGHLKVARARGQVATVFDLLALDRDDNGR